MNTGYREFKNFGIRAVTFTLIITTMSGMMPSRSYASSTYDSKLGLTGEVSKKKKPSKMEYAEKAAVGAVGLTGALSGMFNYLGTFNAPAHAGASTTVGHAAGVTLAHFFPPVTIAMYSALGAYGVAKGGKWYYDRRKFQEALRKQVPIYSAGSFKRRMTIEETESEIYEQARAVCGWRNGVPATACDPTGSAAIVVGKKMAIPVIAKNVHKIKDVQARDYTEVNQSVEANADNYIFSIENCDCDLNHKLNPGKVRTRNLTNKKFLEESSRKIVANELGDDDQENDGAALSRKPQIASNSSKTTRSNSVLNVQAGLPSNSAQ